MARRTGIIRVNALRVQQKADVPLYVFGIEGRLVRQIATVSQADRTRDGELTGYQRSTVSRHVNEIRTYLATNGSLLPNALVVAFDERVTFRVQDAHHTSEWGTFGFLEIPLPRNAAEAKPGWLVDGQQRATALASLDPAVKFPVVVVAFQSSSPELQREQFVLVNKTKPLPRDLINELLPEIESPLPKNLDRTRVATQVLHRLRFMIDSPFYNRIRGLGSGDSEGCNISQQSVLGVIENSVRKHGVLFDLFNSENGAPDIDGMAELIGTFYEGVRRTWPEAWEGSPRSSRLVHGVGIVAIGNLMDRVMREVDYRSRKSVWMVERRLSILKPRCAWTTGVWPVLGYAWNELQNTTQHKMRLSDYLLREYERLRTRVLSDSATDLHEIGVS